jgi:tol-pal system protein YbgF
VAAAEQNLSLLKAEDNAIRGEVTRNFEGVTALRKSTAETGADMADIRDNIQQLRGQIEALRKDLATALTRANKDEDAKEIREKLNNTVFKINFIENFLGIGKREDQPEGTEKGEKPKEVPKGKPDKESAYAAAYELFKDGKFDKGREAFQNFLKQYPDTEYSDNAQFWIGECYYFEKKYENAILEYEKVAKNYPDGDKVPYALLKQGIAFMNLGDKASAKLILQRVINDYPNTNQARTAKATLLNIK